MFLNIEFGRYVNLYTKWHVRGKSIFFFSLGAIFEQQWHQINDYNIILLQYKKIKEY